MKLISCLTNRLLLVALISLSAGSSLQSREIGSEDHALSGHLRITGSSTMVAMLSAMARQFETLHHGVTIEVEATGSGEAVGDVRYGKSDIGMLSRAAADDEEDLFALAIARDGVAPIVHRDNPVAALSGGQLAQIYRGAIRNWKEVGGPDQKIVVVNAPIDCGETELFVRYVDIAYTEIEAQRVIRNSAERLQSVSENPAAIAYASLGEGQRAETAGSAIKLVALDGESATTANIRKGDFPIARPLTLITRELPSGLSLAFIDFVLDSHSTETIEAFGFVAYFD